MKPTILDVDVRRLDSELDADALIIPVTTGNGKTDIGKITGLRPIDRDRVEELRKYHRDLTRPGAMDDHILPTGSPLGRIAFVSLGDKSSTRLVDLRNAAGHAFEWCAKHRIEHAAVVVQRLRALGNEAVEAWVEGFLLAGFRYGAQRSKPLENGHDAVRRLTLATASTQSRTIAAAAERARHLADATNLARFLGHEPPNVINPVTLAERCRTLARQYKLRCTILDDRQMKKKKMGAFLAVGLGSASKPRMIILEHPGKQPKARPVVLVGKAVTLDTGGYSIKPANSIPDMKYDKCGGMAVIGALAGAARLGLRQRVVGIIGAAENMISDRAFRPGDIVRASNGKTIEVLNTDAEGRLVLADCLHYAEKVYNPRAVIDLATLTGACEIALGTACAGLMSTDDRLAKALIDSGERAGERLWRLPLWPVYREQINGTDGDIKNVGGRGAGAITAGMFLKEFVSDKTPWAHLDIAGPATTDKPTPTCPIGATGFGVRLLLDYLQKRK
ncbi:MAG: leucyl aminopeptidase [Phycisphaerales bacterium]|nr:leucyl aminopeptidase [Phycisphaerales bacterium]